MVATSWFDSADRWSWSRPVLRPSFPFCSTVVIIVTISAKVKLPRSESHLLHKFNSSFDFVVIRSWSVESSCPLGAPCYLGLMLFIFTFDTNRKTSFLFLRFGRSSVLSISHHRNHHHCHHLNCYSWRATSSYPWRLRSAESYPYASIYISNALFPSLFSWSCVPQMTASRKLLTDWIGG